jgi:phytoene synthase
MNGLRASYRLCSEIARREARNFYYSFLLLPPARRRSMCALYAFMRHTDDLADEPGPVAAKRTALKAWRSELESALADPAAARSPILPALIDTVNRHAIPPRYLFDVLDGVEMDLEPRRFPRFDDLYTYCYRVASAVGLCCIHIWGFRSEGGRAEQLAESCGIALQLTNILRDVREDAANGRVYLPEEDLARFGVDPSDLASDALNPRLHDLLKFQADRAYDYYTRACPLVALVAPVGRPVLRAIVGIYRSLLDEIARRGYNVLSGRISLSPWRKAAITLRSLAGSRP